MGLGDHNPQGQSILLVEGGGSHTKVFVTVGGKVVRELALPSLNYVGLTSEAHSRVVDHLISVHKECGKIDLTYFAIGAASTPAYLDRVCNDLQHRWHMEGLPWERIIVTNDIVPLMFSEESHVNQLIVISGTGSGVAGRKSFEKVVRNGAHEYLLGDEGGAFDIGRRGLRAVLRFRDNRGGNTVLDDLAKRWSNGQELNWFVYDSSSPKQTIASFTPHVFEADANGDTIAGEILDRSASDLVHICDAALTGLNWPEGVVVTFTGTLLGEPTGRLRLRLKALLRERRGIEKFKIRNVDSTLLQRTAEQLFSSHHFLTEIARAIPGRAY